MGILAPNHVYSSGAHNADDETHDKDVPAFDDDPFFLCIYYLFTRKVLVTSQKSEICSHYKT